MRALAFKSAEVVAMGCGSLSDRKGTFATDTNLFDAVSAVSAVAGPRAIRAARRPIQPFGRDSHTTAFARRAFLDLRGVGAFSRTVTFGAAIWNRLRVALKRLVATIAYESKRHLMLTAGEEDYQEFCANSFRFARSALDQFEVDGLGIAPLKLGPLLRRQRHGFLDSSAQ